MLPCIQDYLTWIQTCPDSHLLSLSEALSTLIKEIDKTDVNLELDELEHAAKLTVQEQDKKDDIHQITSLMKNADLDSDDDSDSSDNSDSSTDSDSDSDSDSGNKDDGTFNSKISESKSAN